MVVTAWKDQGYLYWLFLFKKNIFYFEYSFDGKTRQELDFFFNSHLIFEIKHIMVTGLSSK